MGVTILPRAYMKNLIKLLERDYPAIAFRQSSIAQWSPQSHQVSYVSTEDPAGVWSTLHELGHALLDHRSYESDVSLLQMEVDAWKKAIELAELYAVTISEEHMQHCLDTYRDWLHKRSTCPTCGKHGLQQSNALYRCLNCQGTWMVSSTRFCRPYRLRKAQTQ
jgi:hypothetical protein